MQTVSAFWNQQCFLAVSLLRLPQFVIIVMLHVPLLQYRDVIEDIA